MNPDAKQQPGQTIAPGGSTPVSPPEAPEKPESAAQAPVQAVSSSEVAAPAAASDDSDPNAITWTASEFIAHDKSFSWYIALSAGAVALAAAVFLISHDLVSVSVVIVAALLMGVYGSHQPRQLEYRLDENGLTIGQRSFAYEQFHSFSIIPEGAFSSIVFMPLKRFAVPTTIYYAPQDEDKIVKLLSDRLPLEKGGHDAVDRLMHRIRF